MVQFEKTVVVNGVELSPAALLSDSKPSEVETAGASAMFGSLTAKQNWTFPLYPLSVSKSSSNPLKATKCLQFTAPPNHSNESSLQCETWT